MNKYLKLFLLAAVLLGTTVSIASCEKDEVGPNAPHHNGGLGKSHPNNSIATLCSKCGDFLLPNHSQIANNHI